MQQPVYLPCFPVLAFSFVSLFCLSIFSLVLVAILCHIHTYTPVPALVLPKRATSYSDSSITNAYLQQFHNSKKIFAEFRASESDRKEAPKVAKQIAEGNAQLKIPHYFQLTSKQQAKKSAEDRVEKQHAIHKILQQSTFNFSKLNYLSHYGSEISLFRRLP